MNTRIIVYTIWILCLATMLVVAPRMKQRMVKKLHNKEVIESIPESFRKDIKLEPWDEAVFLCLLFTIERQAEKDAGGLALDNRALKGWPPPRNILQRPQPGGHKIYFDQQLLVEFNLNKEGRMDGSIKKYFHNGQLHWVYYYDEGLVTGVSRVYYSQGSIHREVDWGTNPKGKDRSESRNPQSIKIFNERGEELFNRSFELGLTNCKSNLDYLGMGGAGIDIYRLRHEQDCRKRMLALAGGRLVFGDQDSPLPGPHKIFLDETLWYELNYNSNSLLDGTVKEFYLDGSTHRIYNFVNGVEQEARVYYENGSLESYSKGSTIIYYDKAGQFVGGVGDISPQEVKQHLMEKIAQ